MLYVIEDDEGIQLIISDTDPERFAKYCRAFNMSLVGFTEMEAFTNVAGWPFDTRHSDYIEMRIREHAETEAQERREKRRARRKADVRGKIIHRIRELDAELPVPLTLPGHADTYPESLAKPWTDRGYTYKGFTTFGHIFTPPGFDERLQAQSEERTKLQDKLEKLA